MPGAGRGVMLQAPLQAHTCKAVEVAEDELFNIGHPLDGQIYMKAYDLCVVAESPEADSLLRLETCSDSALQRFPSNQTARYGCKVVRPQGYAWPLPPVRELPQVDPVTCGWILTCSAAMKWTLIALSGSQGKYDAMIQLLKSSIWR